LVLKNNLSNKFPREEKLKSRKLIEQLFAEGMYLNSFPLQMVYLPVENTDAPNFQAGFSVSKRRFKKAVDRNGIKRRMREAYRLNKNMMIGSNKKYVFMFIYTTHIKFTFQEINEAMIKLLNLFIKKTQII